MHNCLPDLIPAPGVSGGKVTLLKQAGVPWARGRMPPATVKFRIRRLLLGNELPCERLKCDAACLGWSELSII
ncbi:hypothetical protein LMG29542_08270 [Paraburkholderia humisilvae]|uniref:Uncharacterized protein n=1 Tax=Paraburkholderia humisilvae TaxID=627669 RepID=A0A6J5F7L2_9BURK|nr:hypothetical protein LMG29542_08270 [Paraburkholderia humisilvae]